MEIYEICNNLNIKRNVLRFNVTPTMTIIIFSLKDTLNVITILFCSLVFINLVHEIYGRTKIFSGTFYAAVYVPIILEEF